MPMAEYICLAGFITEKHARVIRNEKIVFKDDFMFTFLFSQLYM